jgi:hypothetical protein
MILVDIYKFYLCSTPRYLLSQFLLPTEKIFGMNLDAYPYTISDDHLIYTFDSYGPSGKIRKTVRYRLRNRGGLAYFNLGFGDLDPVTGNVDDRAVSNNSDKEKVLATVAATVLDFICTFPDALVYAQGSTPARTRLYQMGISTNWNEISSLLQVYGYVFDSGWQTYEKNVNYLGFLARRK